METRVALLYSKYCRYMSGYFIVDYENGYFNYVKWQVFSVAERNWYIGNGKDIECKKIWVRQVYCYQT